MKKLAMVLTATIMLFTSTAFAKDGDKISAKVKTAFQTNFASASQVSWKKSSDFYFASFTLNQLPVEAAFNEEGELVGTSRKIAWAQLPLNLSVELSKKYADYTQPEQVLEIMYEGQTSYQVVVENSKQSLSLKCYDTGEIKVQKKTKK
jgi:hypothetical protein